jgi:hypothetical protein
VDRIVIVAIIFVFDNFQRSHQRNHRNGHLAINMNKVSRIYENTIMNQSIISLSFVVTVNNSGTSD